MLIDRPDFSWDISVNNSWNRNKLLDLGDGRLELVDPQGAITDDKFAPSYLKVG
jgi:hypothetical protein